MLASHSGALKIDLVEHDGGDAAFASILSQWPTIVGYARYDTHEAVEWLNAVYALLDPYANLFLPNRKIVEKSYEGKCIRKRFDQARTPFQRLIESGALKPEMEHRLKAQFDTLNSLDLHDALEKIVARGPSAPSPRATQPKTS